MLIVRIQYIMILGKLAPSSSGFKVRPQKLPIRCSLTGIRLTNELT